ncbi:unnamed protein product [Heterobilharzia americana]|nr:unnamed protein product [Heterobilharzia americana]
MVQNPHFASWTQLSAQTAGNAAAAAAAAAAAVHPRAASFQFPNASSIQQHVQTSDSSLPVTTRGVSVENSATVTSTNNNFPACLQNSVSLTLQHSVPSQTHTQSPQQSQQLHQHQMQLQQQQQQHQLQLQQQIQLQQQQFKQQQQHSLQQQARLPTPHSQLQQQLHQHLQQRQPGVAKPQPQQTSQSPTNTMTQPLSVIPSTAGFITQNPVTTQTTVALSNQPPLGTSIYNMTSFPSFTTVNAPVKQKRKSKTTTKKPQVEIGPNTVVSDSTISTCGTVSTVCPTSPSPSFSLIPTNGSLSSALTTAQNNSVSSNPVVSVNESCVSPLSTVLFPLPTLPEEILLKIDPSLGDPPPPPHADITITKPYQCDQCFKRYSGMKSLKNHKLTHSDIRPHKCSICGKAFLRADKMRLHEISHLNVKPFECTTCKQRFTRSDKLKIHHRTHTGVRPYACTFCPKRFTRSDKLKIHERIHTKVKPYECCHCGKCFARSDKRRLHEKTHMYGPRPRATGGKKSKTTSAAAAAAAAAAAVVAAASAASFLTVNSIGKTLGLPLAVATPSTSVNNPSSNVFDFASTSSVCTTGQNSMCFPSYHSVSSASSIGNDKANDTQQIPASLSTISFPLPTCQQLHLPSQHHSTLASLAGIAQYHPALFSANPRQFSQTAMVGNSVSFYPTNQNSSVGFSTANSTSYPHAQVMPFLVNSTNTAASPAISFLGSNTVSDSSNNACSVANSSNVYQSPSSTRKIGGAVASFPVGTSGITQRGEISSVVDTVSGNPISTSVSNTNIAAVMAAAALGRQFHQNQQQQYPQVVAYSGSQHVPNVSAFIHQHRQQQQTQESQQSQEATQQQSQQQAHFIHHQTQQSKQVSQQHPSQQNQQQQPRSQFQFYQPQFAHQFQQQTAQLQQDHQNQMLQHQQQVIQLHQQLQQQHQQQAQQQQQQAQQQQLMQQHSAMLQQQGLISPAHSGTSVAAFSLFPQAAAQFIPGVVPAQYAAAAAAHSTHQQYMQVQQQQQYLAAAAAAAAASSGPIHSLKLAASHQPNTTTTTPTSTTNSVIA